MHKISLKGIKLFQCIFFSLSDNHRVQNTVSRHGRIHLIVDEIWRQFTCYPRPVLAFGYCRCLHLCMCVCLSVCPYVCQSLACLRDYSGPVQARIAKFGPKMQKTLVKVPIVLGGNWPWPSRSNLTSNSKLTPFWACPTNSSPPILVRISKFGQQMHFSRRSLLIRGLIDLELDPHF